MENKYITVAYKLYAVTDGEKESELFDNYTEISYLCD